MSSFKLHPGGEKGHRGGESSALVHSQTLCALTLVVIYVSILKEVELDSFF